MTSHLRKQKNILLVLIMLFLTAGFAVNGYGQCTVATDKDDYAPGETVIITGTNWLPGELVQLALVHLDPIPTHDHEIWFVQADTAGNIYDQPTTAVSRVMLLILPHLTVVMLEKIQLCLLLLMLMAIVLQPRQPLPLRTI